MRAAAGGALAGKLPFKLVYVSGEDPSYPASNLLVHNATTRGWMSPKFCDYPQELGLLFEGTVFIDKFQVMGHHYAISSKIELFAGMLPPGVSYANLQYQQCSFTRIGFMSLDTNHATNWTKRELKTVSIKCRCQLLRLVFHPHHVNKYNLYHQVSITAINVIGELLSPGAHAAQVLPIASRPAIHPVSHVRVADDILFDLNFDTTTAQQLRAMEQVKDDAVQQEDFLQAKMLKQGIDYLKDVGRELTRLEAGKWKAVQQEDYETAETLKIRILELRSAVEAKLSQIPGYASQAQPQRRGGAEAPMQRSNSISGAPTRPRPHAVSHADVVRARSPSAPQLGSPPPVGARIAPRTPLATAAPPPVVDGSTAAAAAAAAAQPAAADASMTSWDEIKPVRSPAVPGPATSPRQARAQPAASPPLPAAAAAAAAAASPPLPAAAAAAGDVPQHPLSSPPLPALAAQPAERPPSAPPAGNAATERPPPEPLPATLHAELAPLIAAYGEDTMACLYSKVWSLREHAVVSITAAYPDVAKASGASAFSDAADVLKRALPDPISQVFLASLGLLRALCDTPGLAPRTAHHALSACVTTLVGKLGHSSARTRDAASAALLHLAGHTVGGAAYVAHYLLKTVKKTAWRQMLGQLELLHVLAKQHARDSSSGVAPSQLMPWVAAAFTSPNGKVREKAVEVTLDVFRVCGRAGIEPYIGDIANTLLGDTLEQRMGELEQSGQAPATPSVKVSGTQRSRPAANGRQKTAAGGGVGGASAPRKPAGRKVPAPVKVGRNSLAAPSTGGSGGGNGGSGKPALSPSLRARVHSRQGATPDSSTSKATGSKAAASTPKRGRKAAPGKAAPPPAVDADVDDADYTYCCFCGMDDPSLAGFGMELHFQDSCVMLSQCMECGLVVLVSDLSEHRLHECTAPQSYTECPRCLLAIANAEFEAHARAKSCTPPRVDGALCPLCHVNVSGTEDAWRQHLPRCKNNPRAKSRAAAAKRSKAATSSTASTPTAAKRGKASAAAAASSPSAARAKPSAGKAGKQLRR